MWFFLAIISAVLTASRAALEKKYLKSIDLYLFASGIFLGTSVILSVVILLNGLPEIKAGFYLPLAGTVIINIIATILYLKALKNTDLSIADPIVSFTPVFLIVTSFLMLGEKPSHIGIVGIILIVVGSYILNLKKDDHGKYSITLSPFKNRGFLYMLAVAFLFSLSANFDKITVEKSSPAFASFSAFLLLGIFFSLLTLFKKRDITVNLKKNLPVFAIIGLVNALSAIAINNALLLQIVPYTISIKRTSIIFSVLFGVFIFKEKNAKERLTGALIMLAGVAIILIYK